MWWPCQ